MSDVDDKNEFLRSKTAQVLSTPNEEGIYHNVEWLWDNDKAPAENVNHTPENVNLILSGEQPLFAWPKSEKPVDKKPEDKNIPAPFRTETSEHTLVYGGEEGRTKDSPAAAHLVFSKIMRDWMFKSGKYLPAPETDAKGFNLPPKSDVGAAWRSRRPHPLRQMKLTRDADQAAAAAAWDDDKVALWGHRLAGQMHHHFSYAMLDAATFSKLPKEVQLASIALGKLRDQKNLDVDWDGIMIGLGTDPLSMIGLTSFGIFAKPFQKGTQYAGSKIMNAMKKSLFGAGFLGGEGAVYGAAFEFAKQSKEMDAGARKQIDWAKVKQAGLVTGAITAGIGAGLPQVGPAIAAFNSVAASKARQRSTFSMGAGPTPGIGHNRGPEMPIEGVDVPTTEKSGSPGWKSGVVEMLDGMQAKGDGDQLIAYLYDAKRRGENKVSQEELDVLGLREAFAGKKNVTKEDVRQHIDQNQPMLQETKNHDEVIEGHEDDWTDHEFHWSDETGGFEANLPQSLRDQRGYYLDELNWSRINRDGGRNEHSGIEFTIDTAHMERFDGATEESIGTVEITKTQNYKSEDLRQVFNDIRNEVMDYDAITRVDEGQADLARFLENLDPDLAKLNERLSQLQIRLNELDRIKHTSEPYKSVKYKNVDEEIEAVVQMKREVADLNIAKRKAFKEEAGGVVSRENLTDEQSAKLDELDSAHRDALDDITGLEELYFEDEALFNKIRELQKKPLTFEDDVAGTAGDLPLAEVGSTLRGGSKRQKEIAELERQRDAIALEALEYLDEYGGTVLMDMIEGRGTTKYFVNDMNTGRHDVFTHQADAEQWAIEQLGETEPQTGANTAWSSVTFPGENPNYKEIMVRFPNQPSKINPIEERPGYIEGVHRERLGPYSKSKFPENEEYANVRGQHYEEDTIFHIRMSDRSFQLSDGTSIDGALVHEVQSDFHQKSKNVYKTPEAKKRFEELKKRIAAADREAPFDIDSQAERKFLREHVDQYVGRAIGKVASLLVSDGRIMLGGGTSPATVGLTNMSPDGITSVFRQNPGDPIFKKIEGHGKGKIWKLERNIEGRWQVKGAIFNKDGVTVSGWLPVSKKEMGRDSVGEEMKLTLEAANRVDDLNFYNQYQQARPDAPYKKSWVNMAVRRAAWEAMESGQTVVAFPSTKETVSMIEFKDASGNVPEGIAKTYLKTIPKEIQGLVKQYGGELKLGRIVDVPYSRDLVEKPEAFRVVLWDFSKVIDVIKSKGFRLPAVMAVAAGLNQAAQPKEE